MYINDRDRVAIRHAEGNLNNLKILLLDIELTYAVYYAYPSKREQYLSAKNIKHHQFCPCAAWQWMHEVSRYVVKITDDQKRFKANFRDDFIVAKKLHDLMTEADVIVAHNGDAFDIKHANVLFINHGLGPIPEKKSIDTLKAARKYFAFAGNDLASLSKRFGGPGKSKKPDWLKLAEGDTKEINIAARYCKDDVRELERVFLAMRPYLRRLPALRPPKEPKQLKEKRNDWGGITECDACGSKTLQSKGAAFDGRKMYLRVKCTECGHEIRGKLPKK